MYKAIHPLKILFYVSFCFLVFISLFPGSIFGFLIYGDIKKTPYIINYSLENTFSHLLTYLYISILGFFIYLREFYTKNIFLFFKICQLAKHIMKYSYINNSTLR